MGAIFVVRQLIEKYSKIGKKMYLVFVDLEKAFDRSDLVGIKKEKHDGTRSESGGGDV